MNPLHIVDLLDVTYDFERQAGVLLLREAEGAGRTLAIPVALADAQQVRRAARGESLPRPSTHDLTLALLNASGTHVVSAVVTREEEGLFFAEVHLMTTQGAQSRDARPSDALTLALRQTPRAPILVADEVLSRAAL